jgi:hypothetical protein
MGSVTNPDTHVQKDGRLLMLCAALIAGIRLARDPRAGCKSERVVQALEDSVFLANAVYDLALLRFGGGHLDYRWPD